jgi:hypothetical protein
VKVLGFDNVFLESATRKPRWPSTTVMLYQHATSVRDRALAEALSALAEPTSGLNQ